MKQPVVILLTIYTLLLAAGIVFFDGTGDAGDSVTHYLFARFAPVHHALYFDHWAKPVFVLLASPFAQLGFTGIKVFNALVTLATVFITYKVTVQLKLKNAVLVVVLMMFSPLYYILTLSALTEPLFALFTVAGLYCCVRKKYALACVVISFLPYVRSEGLIIIGVFGLYFLYIKNWKSLPLLLTGSVIYGIAGYFVYHDFLWVFTKIPYATMGSVYGHGPLLHFVEQLINVVGVPVYILFWIGLIVTIAGFLKKKRGPEEGILIALGFLCFFAAHSLFWYLGIFNSMGLKRVLIGIMPLTAIVALNGFDFLTGLLAKETSRKIVFMLLLAYIIIFPFTPNPAAIQWKKDLMLSEEQRMAIDVVDKIRARGPLAFPLVYGHNYLSMVFGIDHFDPAKKIPLAKETIERLAPGGIIIWENKFGSIQSGITKAELDADPALSTLYSSRGNAFNNETAYAVYIKK